MRRMKTWRGWVVLRAGKPAWVPLRADLPRVRRSMYDAARLRYVEVREVVRKPRGRRNAR